MKTPAGLAVVGDEASVEGQVRALSAAGATDLIAWVYPVGDAAATSLERTLALLGSLAGKV